MVIVAAVALAVAAGAVARFAAGRARVPPPVAGLDVLAPDIRQLVEQARNDVVSDPGDATRWGRYGMACQANGLAGAARDAYTTAVTIDRTNAKWWFLLASVEARLGSIDEAVRAMQRAIAIEPSYAPARWRLGLWLLDQNQIDAAQRAFEAATTIDAADRAGWIGLARVALERGDPSGAAAMLERIAASGARDPYTLQLLGTAYRRLGRVDEAASTLAVGARGEPQWADRWTDEMLAFRRGYAALLKDATAFIVAGQFQPAIRILEQLRREKPDDMVLLAHLGQVYVAAGEDATAVPILERVVATEPGRFEAYVDLATGYMHQDNLTRARATVTRALSLNASYAPAYETLGLILWRGGDPRGAIAALEQAVQHDPRNARALVWIGMVQTNADRPADAIDAFARATRIDPSNVDAWIGIANAEMNRHRPGPAKDALDTAQRLDPNRPAVQETLKRLQSLQPSTTSIGIPAAR
jgi:tetratricopeptide (TPR) repeat protein